MDDEPCLHGAAFREVSQLVVNGPAAAAKARKLMACKICLIVAKSYA